MIIDWLRTTNELNQSAAIAKSDELKYLTLCLMSHIGHATKSWKLVIPDQFEKIQEMQDKIRNDPRYKELNDDGINIQKQLDASQNQKEKEELMEKMEIFQTQLYSLQRQLLPSTQPPSGFIGATGVVPVSAGTASMKSSSLSQLLSRSPGTEVFYSSPSVTGQSSSSSQLSDTEQPSSSPQPPITGQGSTGNTGPSCPKPSNKWIVLTSRI